MPGQPRCLSIRVGGVPETVAQEVERQNGDDDQSWRGIRPDHAVRVWPVDSRTILYTIAIGASGDSMRHALGGSHVNHTDSASMDRRLRDGEED